MSSYFNGNSSISFSGAVTSTIGGFGAVLGDGQFSTDITLAHGDSGGAAYVNDENQVSYIVGVASLGAVAAFSMFSYVNQSLYTTINNDLFDAGFNAGASSPDIIMGKDANEYVRGSVRKADIITNGDNDVILAGSGGGLINTGSGQNDVIFLPSADAQSDPGTTVVVTPGTMTLVGGDTNDKLVLLTDRLETTSGQEPTSSSVSDTSSTIQLMGGFNNVGSQSFYNFDTNLGNADDLYNTQIYGIAPPPPNVVGDYIYDVSYALNDSDLCVIVSTGMWDSKIWIKNFSPGDFGLNFTDDLSWLNVSAANTDQQIYAADAQYTNDYNMSTEALTGSVQTQQSMDDDASVTWHSLNAGYEYADIYSHYSVLPDSTITQSSSALATDLADVISNTQGNGTPLTEPPAPSAATAAVVSVATFEADQAQLDAAAGGFSVLDTAANIAQGLDQLSADTALTSITVSDAATSPLMLTVSEALSDQAAIGKIALTGLTIDFDDTAAALQSLTPQQIASLATDKVKLLTAKNGGVTLDAAQALAFEAGSIAVAAPTGDGVTLADSAAALQALTATEIAALPTLGIMGLSVLSGNLSLTIAQALAFETAAEPLAAKAGAGVTLAGAADSLAGLTPDQISGLSTLGLSSIAVEAGSLAVTAAQAIAYEAADIPLTAPSGATVTLIDTAANIASLSAQQLADLSAVGISYTAPSSGSSSSGGTVLNFDKGQRSI